MADQLEKLCGNISLTEGEKAGLTIIEGEVDEVRAQVGRCLVGKIWMGRTVNEEAFKTVLSRIWRTIGGVIFKELDDNIWLFEFEDGDDMRRVLDSRPWSYDRQMLVLTEFDGTVTASQIGFSHSPFWVQIHDMPLLCMTKGIGMKIWESMGQLIEVDLAGKGAGWGRCLRIRVEIDLSQPLEKGRALKLDGKSHWVTFKYDKLPMFCFECGRIIHGDKGCPIQRLLRRNATNDAKAWGVWLRVDDGRRRGYTGFNGSNVEGWNSRSMDRMNEGGGAQRGRRSNLDVSEFHGGGTQRGRSSNLDVFEFHGGQRMQSNNNLDANSGESVSLGVGSGGGRKTREQGVHVDSEYSRNWLAVDTVGFICDWVLI
jgi:hypothetical protein